MVEDRVYRFLIPGCVFVVVVLLLLLNCPNVGITGLREKAPWLTNDTLPSLAIGGSILVVAMGWFCGQTTLVFYRPNETQFLATYFKHGVAECLWKRVSERCVNTREKWISSVPLKPEEGLLRLFVHYSLDKESPGLKTYLQRGWNAILIGWFSFTAVLWAVFVSAFIAGWYFWINDPPESWQAIVWLVACLVGVVTAFGIAFSIQRSEMKHRAELYWALLMDGHEWQDSLRETVRQPRLFGIRVFRYEVTVPVQEKFSKSGFVLGKDDADARRRLIRSGFNVKRIERVRGLKAVCGRFTADQR